jgi:hypothetical protein
VESLRVKELIGSDIVPIARDDEVIVDQRWENVAFLNHLINIDVSYTESYEARSVPRTAPLTVALKRLKMRVAGDSTAAVFG